MATAERHVCVRAPSLDKPPGAQPLPGPEMHCRSWNPKLLSQWACGFPFSLQGPGDFYKEGTVPLLSSSPFYSLIPWPFYLGNFA